MEISGKVLREVEFRDRLRGYDTDEVDEFLEKVAVAVDELRAEMEQLSRRAERAEQRAEEPERAVPARSEPTFDDDALRRTLVLAQRTADLAVAEAREEAAKLLDQARSEADQLRNEAEESARRARSDAEQDLQSRLTRLGDERDRLEREVQTLTRLVESERARLTEALSSALRLVGETLSVSDDLAGHSPAPASSPSPSPAAWSEPDETAAWPVVQPETAATGGPGSSPGSGSGATGSAGGSGSSGGSGQQRLVPDEPASPRTGEPGGEPPAEPSGGPVMGLVPDVEREIAEDAASAYGGDYPPSTGKVRPLPAEDGDDDEELWQRWAAGRDLGVVPGPADFPRTPHRFGQGPGGGLSA